MTKTDDIQTAIKRASLMQTIDNDVAKALMVAETHPKVAEVIMNLHHSLRAMDEEIKTLRRNMMTLAQTVNNSVDANIVTMEIIADLRNRLGQSDIGPEAI